MTEQADLILPNQRAAFGIPRDVVWMNAAQMSALHRDVEAAGQIGLKRKAAPWNSPPVSFFTEVEEARSLFADLIGASGEDIAVCPSASYGIAAAARNMSVGKGQNIIVFETQFPSNVYIWRRIAAETGAEIITVARDSEGGLTDPICAAINAQTAVVAIGMVHWADGTKIDLVSVSQRAKEVGAALVLDGCQYFGGCPFDVAEVDPDFIAAPMYKWLLGPYATGFLYVAPRHHHGRPLEETWMNRKDAANFAALVEYTDAYEPGARRFDMGEKSNFALMPMVVAALKLLLDWRVERIAATLDALNQNLLDELGARGFTPPPEHLRSPHYFGVELPANAPADLAQRMAAEQIYVSVRGPKMRIAPHLWVDEEDVARFLAAVDRHLD